MQETIREITRRHFFRQAGFGIGGMALSSLFATPMSAALPVAKAKRIIYLFMAGAPSQLDMFDHKPALNRYDGQPIPEELIKGERFAFIKGTPRLLGSPFQFSRHGQSGQLMSNLLPGLAKHADDIAIIRSMQTSQFNHAPAQIMMNTGHQIVGRPSMGAWMSYGIGSENRDLPTFVVLLSGENNPDGGKSCWGSGFLPTVHQGVEFRSKGEPVLFVNNPEGVSPEVRRQTLDALRDLNGFNREALGDPEIDTRIAAYEMAYRMQTSVPELTDIAKEPAAVHEAYGTRPGQSSFANNCLLARRLVERGVRFVELYCGSGSGWDAHSNIEANHGKWCRVSDKPIAGLLADLKQRGLLKDTLVVWGGEFGRTTYSQGRLEAANYGRDHHGGCFTLWLAGGGVKPGVIHGETDEFCYLVTRDPVHVHDLNATLLHLLGLDHTRLTYRFQGRDFRLTDVHGRVIQPILA